MLPIVSSGLKVLQSLFHFALTHVALLGVDTISTYSDRYDFIKQHRWRHVEIKDEVLDKQTINYHFRKDTLYNNVYNGYCI